MREDGMRMVRRHPYTFLAAFLPAQFPAALPKPACPPILLYHAGSPEDVICRAANTLVEESWQAGNQMNAILPDPAQVQCPVVVLGAAEDFMVNPASIEATALAYKVEPVFLSTSGHMIQSEIPAPRLAAILYSLLTG